ncbi:MAG: DNA adenine methylase [Solirubrobacteraceae bacterium]
MKWAGSKRSVAGKLALHFPPSRTFFDPFVGGGAMLPFRVGTPAVAADIVPELIDLWLAIRDSPGQVAVGYESRWEQLQAVGHTAFYDIRRRFNATRDPLDLLFLSRTCVNGLIRFNAKGEFNNSLHHTRPGIAPSRLSRIIFTWSEWLRDVTFASADFRETLEAAQAGDFVFLDPPYAASKGRYHKADFDVTELFAELDRLNTVGARWMLTFDGSAGSRSYSHGVPPDLYKHTFSIPTGNSPFPRLQDARLDAVRESVFLNFEPIAEARGALTHAA